jgi:hypothetical protein
MGGKGSGSGGKRVGAGKKTNAEKGIKKIESTQVRIEKTVFEMADETVKSGKVPEKLVRKYIERLIWADYFKVKNDWEK